MLVQNSREIWNLQSENYVTASSTHKNIFLYLSRRMKILFMSRW